MNMRLYVSSVEFLLLLTVFAVVVSKKIHSADTLHRFLLTAEGYASLRNSSEAYCLDSVDGNISKQALMKSRGCVIYYLHTHKTGGSTLCHTAARAGHTVNMRLNCNVEGNKRADWHDFIQKQNLTFAAQENGVFIPERNRYNYLYMTTVRDPFDRIVSHLHMDMCDVTYKQALRFVKASNCHFDPRNATFDDVVMSDCFMTNLTGITSNFYLFHFSGCRYPNCNERDLKLAKNRLEAMSVVMITDTRQQFDRYTSGGSPYFALSHLVIFFFGTATRVCWHLSFQCPTVRVVERAPPTTREQDNPSGALIYVRQIFVSLNL